MISLENEDRKKSAELLKSIPDHTHELITHGNAKLLFEFETPQYLSRTQFNYLISGFVNVENHSFQSIPSFHRNADHMKHPNLLIHQYLFCRVDNLNLINTDPTLYQDRKFCYNCFKYTSQHNHHSLKNKLLICSKCKIARYCNKKCQSQNWKFHKKSCQRLSMHEKAEIGNLSPQSCISELQKQHKNETLSAKTALYLKQIRKTVDCEYSEDNFSKYYEDATVGMLQLIKDSAMKFDAPFFSHLLSTPGMPELVFNTYLVKTTSMQRYVRRGRVNVLHDEMEQFFEIEQPFESCGFYAYNVYITNLVTSVWPYANSIRHQNLLCFVMQRILEIFCDYRIQDEYEELAKEYLKNTAKVNVFGLDDAVCGLLPVLRSNDLVQESQLGIEWNWSNLIMQSNFLDIVLRSLGSLRDEDKTNIKLHFVDILKYVSENVDFEMIWADKKQGSYFLFIISSFAWNLKYCGLPKCNHIQFKETMDACVKMVNIGLGTGHSEPVNIADCVENVVKYHCVAKKDIRSDAVMRLYGIQFVENREAVIWCFMHFDFLKSEQFQQLQHSGKFDIRTVWEWHDAMMEKQQHEKYRTYFSMCTWSEFQCGCLENK